MPLLGTSKQDTGTGVPCPTSKVTSAPMELPSAMAHPQCWLWSPQHRQEAVGAGPEEGTAMLAGLCCEARPAELGVFSLEEKRLQGKLLRAVQC